MDELPVVLGAGAIVLLASAFAVRFSIRLGLPSLLIYLGIGVLIGEAGLGVQFDDATLMQSLGIAALVMILVEGGLTTQWSAVRPGLGPSIVLSVAAVVITVVVTGAALYWLLDLEWRTALLWGAVLSSTDAAAVFSVLRSSGIGRRLSSVVELESGLNDAPSYIAVVLLTTGASLNWELPLHLLYQLVVGAAVGLVIGWAGGWVLRRSALPATGLYPLSTVAMCVLAFSSAQLASASGLLATFLAGLVLGNSRLPHRSNTLSFAEGLGWIAQIGVFVLLGLFASPERLPEAVVPGLVAGLVAVLIARPLAVVLSTTPFRVPWREQAFLSWAGLRGAVPIVLATIPLAADLPGAQLLVDAVFVIVIVFTLLQTAFMTPLARALGVASAEEPQEIDIDAAPLDELGAVLLQARIPRGSRLHGVYLAELRVPRGASVSLVVRRGKGFTPEPTTRLQDDDQLLIVTTEAARGATERRLRAVGRAGPIARWRGETGE
ncbi:potassium/proton antiporter [Saccharomonospora xinjiangensis]|uniref:NhaP-type Na+(K+)/H+ antiporter n=1 Tax=Saccharomonospora xinjiangensis XJ-54 TaxID=882086 RepID=I0V6C7_9PSEU|nr:potassium/proton antiporter [Saccharomonospora xinjiangensis]EID55680.1 NhaP-type Na+(K+)/H+ antiporter [Saccharomonospora xinjiangensis XJ-54]